MKEEKKEFPSRKKGVASIVFAFLMPLIGLILGIYAIVNGKKNIKLDKNDEEAQSGFILGIIGTSISIIFILIYLLPVLFLPNGESDYVTYENFEQISLGSTYEDAKNILGDGKSKDSNMVFVWFDKSYKDTSKSITVSLDDNSKIYKKMMNGKADFSARTDVDIKTWANVGMTLKEIEEKAGKGSQTEEEISSDGLRAFFRWHNPQKQEYYDLEFINGILVEGISGSMDDWQIE